MISNYEIAAQSESVKGHAKPLSLDDGDTDTSLLQGA